MQLLETNRLWLRPIRREDAALMWPALSDARMYDWIARDAPAQQRDVEARFDRLAAGSPDPKVQWLNWTIWQKADDAAVGMMECTRHDDHSVDFAYLIAPRFWRQGLGAEAARRTIDFMIGEGVRTVRASVDTRNVASFALARKLGFEPVETRLHAEWFKGAWSDEVRLVLNVKR